MEAHGQGEQPAGQPGRAQEVGAPGPGYKLEGDDSSGPTDPSAEFVTEPFEETDTGLDAAHQAMISMATLSGHLDGHVGRAGPADGTLPDAPYTATEHARYVTGATIGVAGGKVPTDRVLFSKGTAGGAVKMQVTSGISLAALPTAMRYLGGEQDNESGAQTADRTPGRDALYRTITEPIDVVGAAPDLATQALQNLRNALNAVNPAAGATLGASAQLEGLLAALMMTLKMLQVPIDGPIKYRLPLMARTNFAAMFESLPSRSGACSRPSTRG